MAAPRLPFLWPVLFRSPQSTTTRSVARARRLHSSSRKHADSIPQQRYGQANEPPPHLGGGKGFGPSATPYAQDQAKPLPRIGEELQREGEQRVPEDKQAEQTKQPSTVDGSYERPIRGDPMLDAAESPLHEPAPGPSSVLQQKSLGGVMSGTEATLQQQTAAEMGKPPSAEEHPAISHDEHTPPVKAPHMETPRYVHHFDTYGLVKRLLDAGWSESQSITIMKAKRLMLLENMELARDALVSKSNVENETYLFRAACAELKTEVTSRRRAEQEKMRTERTQLQHEVDILGQRLGQDMAGLKDELKGVFDDRKMAVRNEQREMESRIQQLNYKITVSLQADAKSDVEGLRWVMTRRIIITLAVVVAEVLLALNLYGHVLRERELEANKEEKMAAAASQGHVRNGVGEEGSGNAVLKDGDDTAGLVSLG